MSIKERAAFSEPLYKIVTELTKKLKLNVTNTGGIFVDREVGFVNCSKENGDDGLNTSNSVRKHEKLNCKICNHKLDPIYVHNLQKYLEFKIANPTYHDDEEATTTKKEMITMKWCWTGALYACLDQHPNQMN